MGPQVDLAYEVDIAGDASGTAGCGADNVAVAAAAGGSTVGHKTMLEKRRYKALAA